MSRGVNTLYIYKEKNVTNAQTDLIKGVTNTTLDFRIVTPD